MERQPEVYDFSGYRALLEVLKRQGLKMQAVMSFHACGGNVNDVAQISLPEWVLKVPFLVDIIIDVITPPPPPPLSITV